jgi:cytochrome c biogenesis protein CcmG/thiol:disulfide interchange protein DsbE
VHLKKIFALPVILLSCLALQSCEKQGPLPEKRESSQTQGAMAPDFMLKDIEGRDVRLSQYRGKVVLLEFWATWCPPCKATIPELVAVQNKFGDRGFALLGVSVDEDLDLAQKLSKFSKEHGINYSVLLGNEKVHRAYHVGSIPVSFLIDKEGRIINSYTGYADKFETRVSEEIERIL